MSDPAHNDVEHDETATGRVRSIAVLGGWTYFRDSKAKVSKWVLGSSWVTKWDKHEYCVIGIRGERIGDYYGTTHEARNYVERMMRL